MTTVVKIGGSVLEPAPAPELARALAARWRGGERLCVVHGGGKALTRLLARLGVASRFHRGLRVTDEATLAAALMALAGEVNTQLVAALNRALAETGAPPRAVGLTGLDGGCLAATALAPELGQVGEPSGGDPRLLRTLLAAGFLPVLASLAAAPAEAAPAALNVNADAFAAACARQLPADRLVFLTDVAGVLDAEGRTIAALDLASLAALERQGIAAAGMLPKLAACRTALAAGVEEIEVAAAAAWLAGAASGRTRILADARSVLEAS